MKIIVFDLDGTLIDSAPDIHAAVNRLLDSEGLAPVSLDQSRGFVGNGTPVLIQRLMRAVGLPDDPALHDRLLARFMADYVTAVQLTRPYPYVPEALAALATQGWRIGLCTNKPMAPTRAILGHLGLTACFASIIAGDSLPEHKPDPRPLLASVTALGGGPAVYVGDSEVDADCAKAARLPLALYTEGYRKAPVADLAHAFAFSDYRLLPVAADRLLAPA